MSMVFSIIWFDASGASRHRLGIGATQLFGVLKLVSNDICELRTQF